MKLHIQNNFTAELPADSNGTNVPRQVHQACYSFVMPKKPSNPSLIHASVEVANTIGLTQEDILSMDFLNTFSGSSIYPDTKPYALSYAGHQFGNWAGQLGDGRAINLFEIINNDKRFTLQLKGAGETPYSRTADGFAVLRSSVREHLCSEAMFHLGVPTTRSLSLITTGNKVLRDVMYNGNAAYEEGAVVCRIAPSFIRFGNFQLFSARKDSANLQKLADYTIQYFYPEIQTSGKEKYLHFYQEIINKTVEMVVEWQRVGFVHGVMNTDNMSILGLTIDYGPYGWLEDYDPDWTPNTTDAEGRRYRFKNQPDIALWNLVQLGNALYPLIEDLEAMELVLNSFTQQFDVKFPKMMQAKLGLSSDYNADFQDELITLLTASETDMTIFYRNLASILKSDTPEIAFNKIEIAFYEPSKINASLNTSWVNWMERYL